MKKKDARKKFLCTAILLLLVFSFTACQNDNTVESLGNTVTTEETAKEIESTKESLSPIYDRDKFTLEEYVEALDAAKHTFENYSALEHEIDGDIVYYYKTSEEQLTAEQFASHEQLWVKAGWGTPWQQSCDTILYKLKHELGVESPVIIFTYKNADGTTLKTYKYTYDENEDLVIDYL